MTTPARKNDNDENEEVKIECYMTVVGCMYLCKKSKSKGVASACFLWHVASGFVGGRLEAYC